MKGRRATFAALALVTTLLPLGAQQQPPAPATPTGTPESLFRPVERTMTQPGQQAGLGRPG